MYYIQPTYLSDPLIRHARDYYNTITWKYDGQHTAGTRQDFKYLESIRQARCLPDTFRNNCIETRGKKSPEIVHLRLITANEVSGSFRFVHLAVSTKDLSNLKSICKQIYIAIVAGVVTDFDEYK